MEKGGKMFRKIPVDPQALCQFVLPVNTDKDSKKSAVSKTNCEEKTKEESLLIPQDLCQFVSL